MTEQTPPKMPKTYDEALKQYAFDKAAIGIKSAEGWHERYAWHDKHQAAAINALNELAKQPDRTQALRCVNLTSACAKSNVLRPGLSHPTGENPDPSAVRSE